MTASKTRAKTIDGVWKFYYEKYRPSHQQLIHALHAVSVFLLQRTEPSELMQRCVDQIGVCNNTLSNANEIRTSIEACKESSTLYNFIRNSYRYEFAENSEMWFTIVPSILMFAVKFLEDQGETQTIGNITSAESMIVNVFKSALEKMWIPKYEPWFRCITCRHMTSRKTQICESCQLRREFNERNCRQ